MANFIKVKLHQMRNHNKNQVDKLLTPDLNDHVNLTLFHYQEALSDIIKQLINELTDEQISELILTSVSQKNPLLNIFGTQKDLKLKLSNAYQKALLKYSNIQTKKHSGV